MNSAGVEARETVMPEEPIATGWYSKGPLSRRSGMPRRGWLWALAGASAVCILSPEAGFAQPAQPAQASPAQSQAKQAPPKSAAAKKKAETPKGDPAAAQADVEAGIAALGQGKPDLAITQLTKAIASGSLPSAQSARVLYYRGVAHRRAGKPAPAISDLTNSLWIKGGLTEEQRADALSQRSGAYREGGLPEQGDPQASSKQARAPVKGSATAAATPFSAVAPAAPASSSSGGGFFGTLFGGSSSTATPATAKPATPTAGAPTAAAAVAPAATAAAADSSGAPKPATRRVPITPEVGGATLGFQDIGSNVREVEVSTTARAKSDPGVVAKGWEQATEVKPGKAMPRAPAAGGKAAAAPASATPGVGVQVHIAAVRSAEEARGLANRLQTQYARELGGRAPVVDQAPGGSSGPLYRVQVGPFASARDTEPLCAKLKSGGLGCQVHAQ